VIWIIPFQASLSLSPTLTHSLTHSVSYLFPIGIYKLFIVPQSSQAAAVSLLFMMDTWNDIHAAHNTSLSLSLPSHSLTHSLNSRFGFSASHSWNFKRFLMICIAGWWTGERGSQQVPHKSWMASFAFVCLFTSRATRHWIPNDTPIGSERFSIAKAR